MGGAQRDVLAMRTTQGTHGLLAQTLASALLVGDLCARAKGCACGEDHSRHARARMHGVGVALFPHALSPRTHLLPWGSIMLLGASDGRTARASCYASYEALRATSAFSAEVLIKKVGLITP